MKLSFDNLDDKLKHVGHEKLEHQASFMINRITTSLVLVACLLTFVAGLNAQDATQAAVPTASIDEKSQQILNRAIEVLGGSNYLNVKTVIGKGFFTTFQEEVSQIPARFLDYIAYPDRERT